MACLEGYTLAGKLVLEPQWSDHTVAGRRVLSIRTPDFCFLLHWTLLHLVYKLKRIVYMYFKCHIFSSPLFISLIDFSWLYVTTMHIRQNRVVSYCLVSKMFYMNKYDIFILYYSKLVILLGVVWRRRSPTDRMSWLADSFETFNPKTHKGIIELLI